MFEPTGKPGFKNGKSAPGKAQRYINDRFLGDTENPVTLPISIALGEGLTVGRAPGSPVTERYQPPFGFTGKILSVTVAVSGHLIEGKKAELRVVMARQ